MANEEEREFFYRASAVAFGTQITSPEPGAAENQAAASLPTTGGLGRAQVGSYSHPSGLASFAGASSEVRGTLHPDGKTHDTLAKVIVDDLNIMNVVRAVKVVVQLETIQPPDSYEIDARLDVKFENLRILGDLVEPVPHPELLDKTTFSALEDAYEKADSPFVDRHGKPFRLPRRAAIRQHTSAITGGNGATFPCFEDRILVTSLFQEFAVPTTPPLRSVGGCVHVPGFGRICLGQLIITCSSRRFEAIVCKLGSPQQGRLVFGSVEGNGSRG